MRLAEMMRVYIALTGLEQKAVAQACAVSETTLSRFLAGERLPEADAFVRILGWCTSSGHPALREPMDPNAKIGGPTARYRKEKRP